MSDKVIISAALTGVLTRREHCPAIPYTPEEIAQEGRRAVEAGASILHIHAREDDGGPCFRKERYQEIHDAVRDEVDAILNFSTGAVGVPQEEIVAYIRDVGPEIGALNMGSMNYAKFSRRTGEFIFDFVFQNPFKEITQLLEGMKEGNVKPELECFCPSHIHNAEPLRKKGLVRDPIQYSLILGVLGGVPAETETLVHEVNQLPEESTWQVIGIGRRQWRMVAAALSMGGNVRVGLEDNFYLPNGDMAESNGDLVAKAAQMARDCGRKVASVDETREMMGLDDPWGRGPAGTVD